MAYKLLTDEHLRILQAVEEDRLFVNKHGRYEIADEIRPDRKAREQLIQRGLIAHYYVERGRTPWRLTAKGKSALASALKVRVERFVALREDLQAGGLSFPDAHLEAARRV